MGCDCNLIKVEGTNCATNPASGNWKQISLNEIVSIPSKYPDIVKINSAKLEVKVTSTNFIQTPDSLDIENVEGTYLTGLKLVVTGEVTAVITYNSDDICKIHNFIDAQSFSAYIVLEPGYDMTKPVCANACIQGALITPLDERTIQENISIFIDLL